MNCKICNSSTQIISTQLVLNKYHVNYHQCTQCNFVQTDKPVWLQEAYENVITSLDIGLISRNQYLLETIPNIIETAFPNSKNYIDFGGGYGIFVRMMRDIGYNFYRQDIYCENLFAKHFDLTDIELKKFDILTAFEVFEHLENPLEEIEKMFSYSDNLIFSTELNDKQLTGFANWWYVAPQTGQHVSFYNTKTFAVIARKFKKHYYTNNHNLHILSGNKIKEAEIKKIFSVQKNNLLAQKIKNLFLQPQSKSKKVSLLQTDFEFVKGKLSKEE